MCASIGPGTDLSEILGAYPDKDIIWAALRAGDFKSIGKLTCTFQPRFNNKNKNLKPLTHLALVTHRAARHP